MTPAPLLCPTCGTTSDTCHRRRPCRLVRVVADPLDLGRIVGREVRWRDGHGDPITTEGGRMFAAGLEIERVPPNL